MNKTLNNKINSDLNRIIGTYLLPIIKTKINHLGELRVKTANIKNALYLNRCYDKCGFYCDTFKKSKITFIHIKSQKYWSIREC